MKDYSVRPVGDQALTVEFGNEISLENSRRVRMLARALEKNPVPGMGELVPAYRSLLIHYDPLTADLDRLLAAIDAAAASPDPEDMPKSTVTEIPVLYNGEDLEEIARLENSTVEDVVRIHSGSDYYVYMLGFAPGHPYTARFENPFSFRRRSEPRVRIPGGSIVVQLGLSDIIPFDQPCGWNIIGNTPVPVCDWRKENPFLLRAGQWIRHVPVDEQEYREIRRQVELGEYRCRTYEREG